MKVLVTGANGFVGRNLIPELLAHCCEFRGSVRDRSRVPLSDGVEWVVVGDLSQDTDWSEAPAGMDAIVHLAGRAHVMSKAERSPDLFLRINVDATQALARAALAA